MQDYLMNLPRAVDRCDEAERRVSVYGVVFDSAVAISCCSGIPSSTSATVPRVPGGACTAETAPSFTRRNHVPTARLVRTLHDLHFGTVD